MTTMDMAIHTTFHRVTVKLLRPVARLLLKHGVSYAAFSESARSAFIEEAYEHLSSTGQKSTATAVSALTGLSRKEVRRLKDLDGDELVSAANHRNRAIRVLSGWVNDPDFSETGEPKLLAIEGTSSSFHELTRRYSGDVTPNAMLRMLVDAGSVETRDGSVRLIRNAFIPMSTPAERLNILGSDANELIATIAHNIMSEPEGRRFQRKVSVTGLSSADLIAFQRFSNERSQTLLEDYDAWLSSRIESAEKARLAADQADSSSGASQSIYDAHYVTVGIYYYTEPQPETES